MKIGIFDSGLGGLIICHSLITELPEYDYVYLGDTARVPYGNRSQEAIYTFTQNAIEYLFQQGCGLIIAACNTASAEALRKIQQSYLSAHYPDKKVLGVLIPTAEEAGLQSLNKKIGVLATQSTVHSGAFIRELQKVTPGVEVFQSAAPLLVPLVEGNGMQWAEPIIKEYVRPLVEAGVDTIILGCTHYAFLKDMIRHEVGAEINIISQDEIVPASLKNYLQRHPEIDENLSKNGQRDFLITDLTENIEQLAAELFGEKITVKLVRY